MAAYARAERTAHTAGIRLVPTSAAPVQREAQYSSNGFEGLLVQLADLVADRLATRLGATTPEADEWLDTRGAAEYLGVHRDTIRRLAAERAVPSEQEGPGCKLFFRRSDLDVWRCSGRQPVRILAGARS